MLHKLIKIENYLLVVDNSEIKNGDFFITDDNRIELSAPDWRAREWHKKVISHLPLNNSPILEGVDLLPPIEDDIKQLGIDRAIERRWNPNSLETRRVANEIITGVEYGYNKAKEKYKYTEEDMINAILFGMRKGLNVGKVDETDSDWVNNYVKSLQQPKMPIGFKCEVQILRERPTDIRNHVYDKTYEVPKTTTNSQGITQWVGTYKYE